MQILCLGLAVATFQPRVYAAMAWEVTGSVSWEHEAEEAFDRASRLGKPLMILFSNGQKAASIYTYTQFDNQGIVDLSRKFICIQLKMPLHPEYKDEYKIDSSLELAFIAANGKMLFSAGVARGQETVLKAMKKAIKLHKTSPGAKAPSKKKIIDYFKKLVVDGKGYMQKGKYKRALNVLMPVATSEMKVPSVKIAQELVAQIEEEARRQMDLAKQAIESGDNVAGIEALIEVQESFGGSASASEANAVVAKMIEDPDIKLQYETALADREFTKIWTSARRLELKKKYRRCFRLYKYAASIEGATRCEEATKQIAKLKADPEVKQAYKEETMHINCKRWLSQAKSFSRNGMYDNAKKDLARILKKYPKSEYATEARKVFKEVLRNTPK